MNKIIIYIQRMRGCVPFLLLWCVLSVSVSPGQQAPPTTGALERVATFTPDLKTIEFTPTSNVKAATFFDEYKASLGLGSGDKMEVKKSKTDAAGNIHTKFQQKYNGVPVELGEYILHEKDGRAYAGEGILFRGLSVNTSPTLTPQAAIDLAIKAKNITHGMWESDSEYIPTSQLVITGDRNGTCSVLAYKIDLYSKEPFGRVYAYVDAHTGIYIKEVLRIQTDNGTCITLYDDTQSIFVTKRGFPHNDYILEDDFLGVHTKKYGSVFNQEVSHRSAFFETGEQQSTSAHWATEMAKSFFYGNYNRNSYDNNGAIVNVLTKNNSLGKDKAFWDGLTLNFGTGGGGTFNNAPVSLDCVGHEFTHAVTEYEANLTYSNEPGALNESFSDIFGTMIEYFIRDNNYYKPGNYLLGEDFVSGGLRDMQHPNSKQQPDTYHGTYWYSGGDDYGGVHTNSGVQNHWFYLLSEGGWGTNDNGTTWCLTGIGRDKAAKIAYQNLCYHLTSGSDYSVARAGSIYSAQDLYGTLSDEELDVVNAWTAVGVGSLYSGYTLSNHYISTTRMYRALNSIVADNPFVVNPSGKVTLRVVNTSGSIDLKPGFQVKSGGTFHAVVGSSCDGIYLQQDAASSQVAGKGEARSSTVAQEQEIRVPKEFTLAQNYPNPFNPTTTINYDLPISSHVVLKIYDVLGREIATLVNEVQEAGYKTQQWNADVLPSGMYFYRLTAVRQDNNVVFTDVKKMLLLK